MGAVCGGGHVAPRPAPRRVLPLAVASYSEVTWLKEGSLILAVDDSDERLHLWGVEPDGSDYHRVDTGDDPSCRIAEQLDPTSLADGRLGFVSYCEPTNPQSPPTHTIVGLDLRSRRSEVLAVLGLRPSRVSWNPAVTSGIVSDSSGLCASVARVTRSGVEHLPVALEGHGRRWPVDQDFFADPAGSCDAYGQADMATWSPDGRTIAFFASTDSVGKVGQARIDVTWSLYTMDAGVLRPVIRVRGLINPTGVAWSPDSRQLAISSRRGPRRGTRLLDLNGHLNRRVSQESVRDLAWSPDGTRLVAVHEVDPDASPIKSEVVIFDLAGLAT